MKKWLWLRQLGIILCVVMVVIIAVLFHRVRDANEAEREALAQISREYEETMRPLWKEKERLEREITEQEKRIAEDAPPVPVVLLCTEPNEALLSDVYPIADSFAYPAALVVSEGAFPGDAGCLTESDVAFLAEQGWELCLGADGETDLAALAQRTAAAGLPSPVAVYFPAGDGTAAQEAQALALGIRIVIRYGKGAAAGDTEGIWYLSAYGSSESDAKTVFQTKVRSACPSVLTVGYSNNRERFDAENYRSMLKTIHSYEETKDVEVSGIQNAYSAYSDAQNGAFSGPETEAERRLAELEEALDAVNDRLLNADARRGEENRE